MIQQITPGSLNLRYESYRLKQETVETGLLTSILKKGIIDPLEGVDTQEGHILLNGFKRYRCATQLKLHSVPYVSLSNDEAIGILHLVRKSTTKKLSILEQASLIEGLKRDHNMSLPEIADDLEKSKSWVSLRTNLMKEMSEELKENVFSGKFPAYSYMYTIRPFMRINGINKGEINEFVKAVSGKKLSIREIEQFAYGYFKGPKEFREQIKKGNITWVFDQLNKVPENPDGCTENEQAMLGDLERIKKYMQKVTLKIGESKFKNESFYAQANLLTGAILRQMTPFNKILKDFYDKTGQA